MGENTAIFTHTFSDLFYPFSNALTRVTMNFTRSVVQEISTFPPNFLIFQKKSLAGKPKIVLSSKSASIRLVSGCPNIL